jgi:glucose-1-phosphate cytidylyltransferase
MKAVIFAGGLGTRISEETALRPKPMVEIGSKPILWHILKIYSFYGINEFIICCGYKGYVIKEYFSNYFLHMSDVTFDLKNNSMKVHHKKAEDWKITLIDTGDHTMTGGRLKRVREYLDLDKPFLLTYGDGLSDINIRELIDFHYSHGKLATVTAVRSPGRFGVMNIINNSVQSFTEKPIENGNLINGGFFVLSSKCLDFIHSDDTVWEHEPLSNLSFSGELMAFEHKGFWQPMDTLRDKIMLENLLNSNRAPWKKWI